MTRFSFFKIVLQTGLVLFFVAGLSACADTSTLNAPCTNFGASCQKVSVNPWESSQHNA